MEFDAKVSARLKELMETVLPRLQAQEKRAAMIIKAHKGVFPLADYQKILKCLHPDTQPDAAQKGEAFRIFTEKKGALVTEKESPSNGASLLPATAAELLARRKARNHEKGSHDRGADPRRRDGARGAGLRMGDTWVTHG